MSHRYWEGRIRELKHEYLPSRRVGPMKNGDDGSKTRAKGKEVGEVITDSEAESGGKESAKVWSSDSD